MHRVPLGGVIIDECKFYLVTTTFFGLAWSATHCHLCSSILWLRFPLSFICDGILHSCPKGWHYMVRNERAEGHIWTQFGRDVAVKSIAFFEVVRAPLGASSSMIASFRLRCSKDLGVPLGGIVIDECKFYLVATTFFGLAWSSTHCHLGSGVLWLRLPLSFTRDGIL